MAGTRTPAAFSRTRAASRAARAIFGSPCTSACATAPSPRIMSWMARLSGFATSSWIRSLRNKVRRFSLWATAIAVAHKEKRRTLFRKLLIQLEVANPDSLAIQLMILGEGAVAQALVHGDPKMARAAREAARVLLNAAGVRVPAIPNSAGGHQLKRRIVRRAHR